MKRIEHINLAGFAFQIDEDAAQRLRRYLDAIHKAVDQPAESAEVVEDVEARLVELFNTTLLDKREVVSIEHVEKAIAVLGEPEEFSLKSENEASEKTSSESEAMEKGPRRLHRNPDDKIFGGVSGGLAAYFGIDPILIRIGFIVSLFAGFGFLLYLILWIAMPKAKTIAQKLEMRGLAANVGNIRKFVQGEQQTRGQSGPDSRTRYSGAKKTGALAEAGEFISQLFLLAIKAVGRLIGWMMVAFGIFALIVVFAWLTGTIDTSAGRIGASELHAFLSRSSDHPSELWILYAGFVLLLVIPALYALAVLIRTVLKLPKLDLRLKAGVLVCMIAGGVLLGLGLSSAAADWREEDSISTVVALDPEQTSWRLETTSSEGLSSDIKLEIEDEEFRMILAGDSLAVGWVDVSIESSGSEPGSILTTIDARGSSEKNARENARSVSHPIEISDSVIRLPALYGIPSNQAFRMQRVRHLIRLPEGSIVTIGAEAAAILGHSSNNSLLSEDEMAGHRWKVGPEGLECLDCTPEELEADPFESRAHSTDSTSQTSVDLRKRSAESTPGLVFSAQPQHSEEERLRIRPIPGLSIFSRLVQKIDAYGTLSAFR